MKSFTISTSLLAGLATSVHAQVVYNSTTHTLQCLNHGYAFCGSSSTSTNIIIRCYGKRAVPGNCGDNLAGISPIGVKASALCYEPDSFAGNAACAYNGVAYPDGGSPFQLPPSWPQLLHNTTNSSVTASTTSTITLNLPTGYVIPLPTAIVTLWPIAPGSGGYNGSSIAGTGAPVPTRSSIPPKPSATFIGGAAKTTTNVGLLTAFLMVFRLFLFA